MVLPVTESREIMAADLEYYGVEVVEDSIDDAAVNKLKCCFKSIKEVMDTLEGVMTSSGEEHFAACSANRCIKKRCNENTLVQDRPREVEYYDSDDDSLSIDENRNLHKFEEIQSDNA